MNSMETKDAEYDSDKSDENTNGKQILCFRCVANRSVTGSTKSFISNNGEFQV